MNLRRTLASFSFLLVAVLLVVSISVPSAPAFSKEREGGYGGLEFFGSSQTSRPEIDKVLHLKPGATYETIVKAVDRLNLAFEKKSVKANVEVVPDSGYYYVTVDVADTGFQSKVVNRRLIDSHHVYMKNEKPMELLTQLKTRLQKLVDEGRQTTERYQDGIRLYDDAPCLGFAESMMNALRGQTGSIMKILESDPNGERRAMAAELLNWCPDPIMNCKDLIPALDDSDMRVRMAASKYIWARVNLLPAENVFPFYELVEGLSRQLTRPSHHDRVRAIAALTAVAKRDSDSLTAIKEMDEAKLNEIASNTVIPSVKANAQALASACANPPPIKNPRHPGESY